MNLTISVAAAEFGRDMEEGYRTIARLIEQARLRGSHLLVLPEACLGGYLPSLGVGTSPRRPSSADCAHSRPHSRWMVPSCAESSTWQAIW